MEPENFCLRGKTSGNVTYYIPDVISGLSLEVAISKVCIQIHCSSSSWYDFGFDMCNIIVCMHIDHSEHGALGLVTLYDEMHHLPLLGFYNAFLAVAFTGARVHRRVRACLDGRISPFFSSVAMSRNLVSG